MRSSFGIARMAAVALASTTLFASANASAHAFITSPPPRAAECEGACKTNPCGSKAKGAAKMSVGKNGSLTVTYNETVDHTGCFIVEVSSAGDEGTFKVLKTIPDRVDANISRQNPKVRTETIALDGSVTCTNCTLRLRQIMTGGNPDACTATTAASTYFSCADIAITDDGAMPDGGGVVDTDSGAPEDDGGTSAQVDSGTTTGNGNEDPYDSENNDLQAGKGACGVGVPTSTSWGGVAVTTVLLGFVGLFARGKRRRR